MWYYNTEYLCHHGIRGQKWGVRRYQNEDGSLTPAGRKKYGSDDNIRYQKLRKKKSKDLTNEELEFINKRKELESKRDGGNSEVGKMIAKEAIHTVGKVATVAAIAAGAKYLAKKYNINAETVTKYVVNTAGKVATTAGKEVAKGTANIAKDVAKGAGGAVKEAAKTAATNVKDSMHDTRKRAASSQAARKYVQTVDKLIKTVRH